ncbi:MAG: amidohydrolase family protein [Corticimicrobacter sp.]|uniref:amidohydrolase family protein n=1 Tax=Corticimicrobacter sp. TaxID=2678536 RepID=UPI0032DB85ED
MPNISGIDTHAHIFRPDLPMTADRRYAPGYDALVDTFIGNMRENGLSHGVLVQPSFLGTDNSFMLDALAHHPGVLRGTAVVDPAIGEAELDVLEHGGVVGVRLNLVGQPLADYTDAAWQAFFGRLARRHWSVEIQRGMTDLPAILPAIGQSGVAVIVDHFGLPSYAPEHAAQLQAFLNLLPDSNIWIKLSAPYRSQSDATQAADLLARLRAAYGHSDHFLWGSDWPHTRFEDKTSYAQQVDLFKAMVPDTAERQKILVDNPARIFHFDNC